MVGRDLATWVWGWPVFQWGWFPTVVMWFDILFGWIVGLLIAAVVSGAVKRE